MKKVNNNNFIITDELLMLAKLRNKNISVLVEDGIIKIIEDKDDSNKVLNNRSLMNKKGAIYIPAKIRRELDFVHGAILEFEVENNKLVVKRVDW